MIKHINFCGYSLWESDKAQQKYDKELSSKKRFYSPRVLAAYCIFTHFFVGILLYGINIYRRGYLWKGRVFITLSALILAASLFMPSLNQFTTLKSGFLLTGLIALSLYTLEKPHFHRTMRTSTKQARWWLPLLWIGAIWGTMLLLKMLFA